MTRTINFNQRRRATPPENSRPRRREMKSRTEVKQSWESKGEETWRSILRRSPKEQPRLRRADSINGAERKEERVGG